VVRLRLQAEGGRLHGRVRDFGDGVDGLQGLHAPALFRSTKPDGLGIGLALSHATVERLGGRLSLSRAPGGGTQVSFDVPLAPPP
jgi:two-component system sensor histidine kinase RegB